MKALGTEENFLGISEPEFFEYESSKFVIQSAPYEYTSSYLAGSDKGPAAIIEASQYVEFYDEELDRETYKLGGIATLSPMKFDDKFDADAIELIYQNTKKLIADNKFVISLGAEHTVTLGFVKAHLEKYPDMCVLQIDAHSDLRISYHGNPYSHASVMARVNDLGVPMTQVGIRAQCKEESDLIKSTSTIHTFYDHQIKKDPDWINKVISSLGKDVYVTIDADGFDPAVIPNVGTAEPGGLLWQEALDLLKAVSFNRNVIGFDIVEVAPKEGQILSEFTLAKLLYRFLGYITSK